MLRFYFNPWLDYASAHFKLSGILSLFEIAVNSNCNTSVFLLPYSETKITHVKYTVHVMKGKENTLPNSYFSSCQTHSHYFRKVQHNLLGCPT